MLAIVDAEKVDGNKEDPRISKFWLAEKMNCEAATLVPNQVRRFLAEGLRCLRYFSIEFFPE